MQQLKADVVELKAEIERLNAEVAELDHEDTKQTTKAMPGHTIVVAFTEDEATGMRHIAEEPTTYAALAIRCPAIKAPPALQS